MYYYLYSRLASSILASFAGLYVGQQIPLSQCEGAKTTQEDQRPSENMQDLSHRFAHQKPLNQNKQIKSHINDRKKDSILEINPWSFDKIYEKFSARVVGLSINSSKDYLLACDEKGMLKLLRESSGEVIKQFNEPDSNKQRSCFFIADAQYIVSLFDDKIVIHDTKTFAKIFEDKGKGYTCASINYKNEILAVAENNLIHIWNLKLGKKVSTLRQHQNTVHKVQCSPCQNQLVSGDESGIVLIWDLEDYQVKELTTVQHATKFITFSPNGQQVFTGDQQNWKLWHMDSQRVKKSVQGRECLVNDGVFLNHRTLLLAGGLVANHLYPTAALTKWNIHTDEGENIKEMRDHPNFSFVVSEHQGHYVYTADREGYIFKWKI